MAEVINAFTRKPFVPPVEPVNGAEPAPFVPNPNLLSLLDDIREAVESGRVTDLAVAMVSNNTPAVGLLFRHDVTMVDLALLNAAIDMAKDQMLDGIAAGTTVQEQNIPVGGEDPEDDAS